MLEERAAVERAAKARIGRHLDAERMQSGRRSDGYDGGVLLPYWDPVQQYFARLAAAAFATPDAGS